MAGRQDRHDVLDATYVLEGVERKLERLAPKQQQPVRGGLTNADRAVACTDATQVVGDGLATKHRDSARVRIGSDRNLEGVPGGAAGRGRRNSSGWGRAREVDDGHHRELVDRRDPVQRGEVIGDLARPEGPVIIWGP